MSIYLADGEIANAVDVERGTILDSRAPWPAGFSMVPTWGSGSSK
jgi:hypothetical protein